jgi:hypothetical protein
MSRRSAALLHDISAVSARGVTSSGGHHGADVEPPRQCTADLGGCRTAAGHGSRRGRRAGSPARTGDRHRPSAGLGVRPLVVQALSRGQGSRGLAVLSPHPLEKRTVVLSSASHHGATGGIAQLVRLRLAERILSLATRTSPPATPGATSTGPAAARGAATGHSRGRRSQRSARRRRARPVHGRRPAGPGGTTSRRRRNRRGDPLATA